MDGKRWWYRGLNILDVGATILSDFKDFYEIFAHIAEAKSPPLGAAVEGGHTVGNVITENFDTNSPFIEDESQRFRETADEHSAQFLGVIQQRWRFWDALLDAAGIIERIQP